MSDASWEVKVHSLHVKTSHFGRFNFARGHVLVREDTFCGRLYILVEGECKAVRRQQIGPPAEICTFSNSGCVFGDVCPASSDRPLPMNVSVIASGNVRVLGIDAEQLMHHVQESKMHTLRADFMLQQRFRETHIRKVARFAHGLGGNFKSPHSRRRVRSSTTTSSRLLMPWRIARRHNKSAQIAIATDFDDPNVSSASLSTCPPKRAHRNNYFVSVAVPSDEPRPVTPLTSPSFYRSSTSPISATAALSASQPPALCWSRAGSGIQLSPDRRVVRTAAHSEWQLATGGEVMVGGQKRLGWIPDGVKGPMVHATQPKGVKGPVVVTVLREHEQARKAHATKSTRTGTGPRPNRARDEKPEPEEVGTVGAGAGACSAFSPVHARHR
jgi:CRP-like cAMP-binding protein